MSYSRSRVRHMYDFPLITPVYFFKVYVLTRKPSFYRAAVRAMSESWYRVIQGNSMF